MEGGFHRKSWTSDVGSSVASERLQTARQKAAALKLKLGSIATYAPVISRKFITQEATSLNQI